MEKELKPLHDLRKSQLVLPDEDVESTSSAPAENISSEPVPAPQPAAPDPVPVVSPPPIPTSPAVSVPQSNGSSQTGMAYSIGSAEYKLATEQNIKLIGWLTLLSVLGGVGAVIVAGAQAFATYRRQAFGLVSRNQYRNLIIALVIANILGFIVCGALFLVFAVFRESFSGYYVLSFLLTIVAQGLFGYAKIAAYNKQSDAHH